ncbi:MAG: hypothetical protein N2512_09680, partial [Armatimonadetes bacterium]|nr:hypothetical protein [Armatimonadota bacterium]
WRFATNHGWTDIHLKAVIPACDGLQVTVSGEGAAAGSSLRLMIKDAQENEFVSPRHWIGADRQVLCFTLSDFEPAPWRPTDVPAPRMPLSGLKLVLDGLSNAEGVLSAQDLQAVAGRVAEREERSYESPWGEQLCLAIDDPVATPIAREPSNGAVLVAARPARGRARHVLSTLPYVPLALLIWLMDEAGVHRYVDSPDVIVRADNRLIALHTAKGGRYALSLPRPAKLRDALTGKQIGQRARVSVDLPASSTTLVEVE